MGDVRDERREVGMTILVTGGAGYIGSHMVLALLDRGERPVVLDDLSTGFRTAVPQSVPFVQGDIEDGALVSNILAEYSIDEVAHFAARTVVPDSVRDPLTYYEANTSKTRSLIATASRAGIERFVFSSTAAVYGDPAVVSVEEDMPLAPINPYGRSKLMSEWILADAAAAHGFHYAILRYFNVAGADHSERAGQSTLNATHLIKVACQVALGMRPYLSVFGTDLPTKDGTGVRDYIQVGDLAEAHVAALKHLRAGGNSLTVNCGYGHGHSVLEVISAVQRACGKTIPVRYSPRRSGDPAAIIANVDRIRAKLDWHPEFDDLDAIVMQALSWEKRTAQNEGALKQPAFKQEHAGAE